MFSNIQIAQDLYGGQIGLDRFSVFVEDLSRIAALRIRGLNPDSGTLLHIDGHLKNQQSSGSRLHLDFHAVQLFLFWCRLFRLFGK